MPKSKNTDEVTDYCRRVVAGKVKGVGKLHIGACQRHLDDLERQNDDDFPYVWRPEKASRVIDFAQTLTLAEGTKRHQVELLPHQKFEFGSLFGWIRKGSEHIRRFRRSYISMARQNGKSFTNGILLAYIASGFSGENYEYGKLFTVATKQSQARIVFEELEKFIEADPDLCFDKFKSPDGLFRVFDYKSQIECLRNHTTIEALSRERSKLDGFRPLMASCDELHQFPTPEAYNAMWNGMRGIQDASCLLSTITTRGTDIHSFAKEMDDYCVGITNGDYRADDFFVDIHTLDEGDNPWDEKNWSKANPFLATRPDLLATMRQDAESAKDMPSRKADFMTKGLNMWHESSDLYFIPPTTLSECLDDVEISDFAGQPCTVGMDLSHGGDLTSVAFRFERDGKVNFFHHSFMPRGRLEEHLKSDVAPYDDFAKNGLLTLTGTIEDFKNDYSFIVAYLAEARCRLDLTYTAVGYDPHNADGFLADLDEALGCPLIEVKQSARSLNDTTADIQLLAQSHRLVIPKSDGLLIFALKNSRITKNSFEEIKIDKSRRVERIDPADAMVCAHFAASKITPAASIGEQTMTDYLDLMGWR